MNAVVEGSQPPEMGGTWAVPPAYDLDGHALDRAMEACRQYLLLIADRELDDDLRGKGGASDLVQDTFLEAHACLPRFTGRSEGELRAWLRRILLNNLSNFRRHYRTTEKRRVGRELSIHHPIADGPSGHALVSREDSPSQHAQRQEQADALAEAMGRLPEDYRRVLLWRHQEQLGFKEIGGLLGSSADAARMLWARAVKRLQRELRVPDAAGFRE